jgi:alpha-glucosidase
LQISFVFGAPLFLIDASTAEGQSHYANYVAAAMSAGVDGWMADYGEALPYDAVMNDGTPGALAHNDYPRSWAQTNFSAMLAARPSGDFVTFNRSGSAGISALTSVHWLGDQTVSFDRNDGLGSVLPLYLSAALSGISLTHSDVGGYTSDGGSLIRSDELWTRWLELEAFTPVLRTHHTSFPSKNVQWDSSPENIARFDRYARWHQRLLPYFAALAAEAHASGTPAVRPIWWKSENPDHFAIDQEVLVGDDLLLAPIVEAGARARSVVFPDGAWRRWHDFAAPLDAPLIGETLAQAGLEDAVVYLRAGAVIPTLAADVPSVADTMPAQQLLIVSGAPSEGSTMGVSWKLDSNEALPPGPLDGFAGRVIDVSGSTVLDVSVGGVPARFELTSDGPISLRFE